MDAEFEDVELAKQVQGYQRRTESGKVVSVRGYVRTDNSAVADRARQSPGRPSVAAASGRFPADRAIPVWPDAGKGVVVPDTPEEEEELLPEYEGIEETGVVDQETLDKEVPVALEIMSHLPQNPALRKMMGILRTFSTAEMSDKYDPEGTVELASRRGSVRVKGYSYVNKAGKVVVVNPYTQIRRLMIAMGGPTMAARRGLTPELLDKALPGFQIKDKLFKAKDAANGPDRRRRMLGAPSSRKVRDALVSINRDVKVDREFDVPKPKPGEDYMAKAMMATNPLEAVRNAQEGSQVFLGAKAWVRSGDGKWYSVPRRNEKGKTDRQLTKEIASRGGNVQLHQGTPIERTLYSGSKVDVSRLDPDSPNHADAVRYAKTLAPVMENVPEGVADSLNGHLVVKPRKDKAAHLSNMITTQSVREDKFYPKLNINPDPEFEREIIKTIPKQQQQGYMVPTTLHPMETVMARESAGYFESLLTNRAPAEMLDTMYDRLSAVYDKHIKNDDKNNFIGRSGRDGWIARLTGDRPEELINELRDKMSLTATNSPEDFLAEAWTEFVGNPTPRPMAAEMGYAFQRTLDEFSNYLRRNKWADASEIPDTTWEKSTQKSLSRTVNNAIGGAADFTTERDLAPRDLRAVLNHSSKYVDVRDDNGNPLFDAEVERMGNTATISELSLPLATDREDMPTGVPNLPSAGIVDDKAKYFKKPADRLMMGDINQSRYAAFVDREKSLRALEAIEETLFRQGVTRAEANTLMGDSSLLHARAGYVFDPNTTDHIDIINTLKGMESELDGMKKDLKEGFYEIPQSSQIKIRRAVNKWLKNISEDPETWPTPAEIASLGKININEPSMGERAMENMAWDGVKILDGKGLDLDDGFQFPTDPNIPDIPPPVKRIKTPEVKDVIKADEPRASTLGDVARAVTPDPSVSDDVAYQNTMLKKSMENLGNEVLAKHRSVYPDAQVRFTGDVGKHRLTVKNGKETIFSMGASIDGDNITLTGPTHAKNDLASAVLAFEMLDNLEASYQQSGLNTIYRNTKKSDPIAGYVLASSGYTWRKPPSKEVLNTLLRQELDAQMEDARAVMTIVASLRADQSETSAMFRMNDRIDREIGKMRESLEAQIGAYLQKFDADPDGPTPFELAQLGKAEAHRIAQARALLPPEIRPEPVSRTRRRATAAAPKELATGEVIQPRFNPNAPEIRQPHPLVNVERLPKLPENPTTAHIDRYNRMVDRLEREIEFENRKKGTMLQQMTSLDSDATHDTFAEFLGKQALTLGAYGWYKSLGGWWRWASDSYKPSARKSTVSLLFMLLRLLPSGLTRGALLTTTNMLVKKLKSPKPEDWPTPGEIEDVLQEFSEKVPDSVLRDVFGG